MGVASEVLLGKTALRDQAHGRIHRALTTLATSAPVRLFIILGVDPPAEPALLRLQQDVTVLDSPRSATVLLIAGSVPDVLRGAVQHVHDEMAQPRSTVRWTNALADASPDAGSQNSARYSARYGVQHDITSPDIVSLVAILKGVQRDLITGEQSSEADELPGTSVAAWRGVGPYGQGGSGMTGGVPYGRPMAERAPDRDGLELDQLPLRIGPYFNAFPAGLTLDVQLQGDVVQEVVVSAEPVTPLPAIFSAALDNPVSITAIECARAQEQLRWLAHALRVYGLPSLGDRTLRLAVQIAADGVGITDAAAELHAIVRRIQRSGLLWWTTRGVGVLSRNAVADQGLGPVARASGVPDDARMDDPAYRALGFQPIVNDAGSVGDSSARLRQRLAEVAQSLDLAARANGSLAWGRGCVEGPRGRVTHTETPDTRLYGLLPELLRGTEWGDAVTTIVSMDLGTGGDVRTVQPWAAAEKLVQAAQEQARSAAASGGSSMNDMEGMGGMADMGKGVGQDAGHHMHSG